MKEDRFIKDNSEYWNELESLINNIKKNGIKTISRSQLESFILLYKKVSRHLSYAITNYPHSQTTEYLNNLVTDAHSIIYKSKNNNVIFVFFKFFFYSYPLMILKYYRYLLFAILVFFLGTVVFFCLTHADPANSIIFFPENTQEHIKQTKESGKLPNSQFFPASDSSLIFTNNTKVGFLSFGFGFTFGIGTFLVLFNNGALLGSLAALFSMEGLNTLFWAHILPHGVFELFAIFIDGAAGFIIGYALINPGIFSRKDAIILRGKESIKLVIGSIPIYITAGLIEGFFTPSSASNETKLMFSALMMLITILYLFIPYQLNKHNNNSQV